MTDNKLALNKQKEKQSELNTIAIYSYALQASNPGQFEPPDSDATWQKNGSTLYYNNGSVAIGTDRALAPLTVGGDIYCSGVVHRPSDRRIKEAIHEVVCVKI